MAISVTDALNNEISLNEVPERIISLVPSVTYTLYYFEMDKNVTGITRFCKLPQNWRQSKTIIGGTKDIKIDRMAALQPDLIIANKEENTKETVMALQKIAPVYVSEVFDIPSNTKFISDLGNMLQKNEIARELNSQIDVKLNTLKSLSRTFKSIYMIWQKPWMTVGGDTFINYMMQSAGFINIFANRIRYPETDIEELRSLKPDILLLSSEPFPFKEKHKFALQQQLPDTKILLVVGEPFTWFGAYVEKGLDYLLNLKQQVSEESVFKNL